MLDLIRCVLVRTSHPGNIGSAARALKTMGLSQLVLAGPLKSPDETSIALASGAGDLVENARICVDLVDAVSDCRLVLGCSARSRGIDLPALAPHEAARELCAIAAQGHPVALVFGNEQSGLSNDELKQCHFRVEIPANPEYSSLNLAQAVQVLAYELRVGALGRGPVAGSEGVEAGPMAELALMEGFYSHLAAYLDSIDFHKGRNPESVLRQLRRLLNRARPDARELNILRGILSDSTRLLRGRGETSV